jgi:hypothetical protein
MSKRNFTLLIIFLVILVIAILGFLYYRKLPTDGTNNEGGTNFLSRFNPFGTTPPAPPQTNPLTEITENPPETTTPEIPVNQKLKKISSIPVAGYGIFLKERLLDIPIIIQDAPTTETTTAQGKTTPKKTKKPAPPATEQVSATRYVARATGNVYQTFLDKIEERKFSTTVVPKVYEAYFGNKTLSVLMRYLKSDNRTVETFLGAIPKEILGADTDNNEIKGVFLPDNISDLSISPDTTKLFYIFSVDDIAVGTVLNLADSKKTQVFDSQFQEWLSSWPNVNLITLTTKPSASAEGHMYALNLTTKSFTRTLGDIYGLTTLTSPDGKFVLYGNSGLTLNIYDMNKKTSTLLGVRTLPEKCTWSGNTTLYCAVPTSINGGQYPDSWYQGETSFSDQIWKLDLVTTTTEIISDPATLPTPESIDGIKLSLDANGKYLLFVNKKDSFLWELDLN